MILARLTRRLHRLHRALGSALCALLLVWFASGLVMTFASFPHYSARARLQDLRPLSDAAPVLPASLRDWLTHPSRDGRSLALVQGHAAARWMLKEHRLDGAAHAGTPVPLSAVAARLEAERVTHAPAQRVRALMEADQWTVPLPSAAFPLWHVSLKDARRTELYFSQSSGEIVQRTDARARLLAWLGPIPHWIYPTLLRRQRTLWKQSVIALAGFGMLLVVSGLWIGVDTAQRLRRRSPRAVLRKRALRWHQRVGLGFGGIALTWLFSGILSFTPFAWTAAEPSRARFMALLHAAPFSGAALDRLVPALALCQREFEVKELTLRTLSGSPLAVCAGDGATRLVRLDREPLRAEEELDAELVRRTRAALEPMASGVHFERLTRADDYYYATHAEPDLSLPVLRAQLGDREHSVLYLDLHTGALLQVHTWRTRLERWLYHGLHSWDLAVLYQRPRLWRAAVWSALLMGALLSALGLWMALSSYRRRRER